MSTNPCDACPLPGYCCHAFPLNIRLSVLRIVAEAEWERLRAHSTGRKRQMHDNEPDRLPYELLRPLEGCVPDLDGKIEWRFSCPALGADGRCTIYESRPAVCREYKPGQDALCARHPYYDVPNPIKKVANLGGTPKDDYGDRKADEHAKHPS